jgi:hypothetical protein
MILDEEMICIYYYKQKELNIIYMSNLVKNIDWIN